MSRKNGKAFVTAGPLPTTFERALMHIPQHLKERQRANPHGVGLSGTRCLATSKIRSHDGT